MSIELQCSKCSRIFGGSPLLLTCTECRAPLVVAKHIRDWDAPAISLGEGSTPLISLKALARDLNLKTLVAKLEFCNPTGSFKDRGSAYLISTLQDLGITSVAEDSSGNAGASIAAYCARAQINTTIFVPTTAPPMKLDQISVYGAQVRRIKGTRRTVADACERYCKEKGVVYASHNLSPYFVEGTRTFTTEICAQFEQSIDHILFPVGNGSLLLGTWRGYRELQKNNQAVTMPRLHCVQSVSCMPIVATFTKQVGTLQSNDQPPLTGGIAIDDPSRKDEVMQALSESGGCAIGVDDREVLKAQKQLAVTEGLFVEPTSAAVLAGLRALVVGGHIKPQDTVLLPLTGSGLKDQQIAGHVKLPEA